MEITALFDILLLLSYHRLGSNLSLLFSFIYDRLELAIFADAGKSPATLRRHALNILSELTTVNPWLPRIFNSPIIIFLQKRTCQQE
jgi:hypothetical protein